MRLGLFGFLAFCEKKSLLLFTLRLFTVGFLPKNKAKITKALSV